MYVRRVGTKEGYVWPLVSKAILCWYLKLNFDHLAPCSRGLPRQQPYVYPHLLASAAVYACYSISCATLCVPTWYYWPSVWSVDRLRKGSFWQTPNYRLRRRSVPLLVVTHSWLLATPIFTTSSRRRRFRNSVWQQQGRTLNRNVRIFQIWRQKWLSWGVYEDSKPTSCNWSLGVLAKVWILSWIR